MHKRKAKTELQQTGKFVNVFILWQSYYNSQETSLTRSDCCHSTSCTWSFVETAQKNNLTILYINSMIYNTHIDCISWLNQLVHTPIVPYLGNILYSDNVTRHPTLHINKYQQYQHCWYLLISSISTSTNSRLMLPNGLSHKICFARRPFFFSFLYTRFIFSLFKTPSPRLHSYRISSTH